MTDTMQTTAPGTGDSFDGVGCVARTAVLGSAPARRLGSVLVGRVDWWTRSTVVATAHALGIVGSPRIADAPTRTTRVSYVKTTAFPVAAFPVTTITVTGLDAPTFRGRHRWRPV